MPVPLRSSFRRPTNSSPASAGIWLEKDERRVNAKSLLGVLSLGIVKGTTITLLADGADEKEAVTALCELVSSNFGE